MQSLGVCQLHPWADFLDLAKGFCLEVSGSHLCSCVPAFLGSPPSTLGKRNKKHASSGDLPPTWPVWHGYWVPVVVALFRWMVEQALAQARLGHFCPVIDPAELMPSTR